VNRFRQSDGLPNETVYSVLPDDAGCLWVATNQGLARVTPSADGSTASFRSFDVRDGLQSNEFNGGAFHRGPTGTLWFGGILGITGVLPTKVKDDPFAAPVAVLSFSKLGQRLPASEWLGSRSVTLGPGEGFFTIEFAALAFRAAAKNTYKWKLEGLDPDWVLGGGRRRADYTSVPPGEYVFRVTAANKDGVWNKEGASLRITVRLPWWKTPAATAMWLVLLAISGMIVSRLEKWRVLRKERQRSQLVEAELRARAAEAQARAVQAESDRKTTELEDARAMQLSLLPRESPRVPGFEVKAVARTATEVGGDTWDWAVGPDGALALVIGDATGHGVRAGTVVSVMKGLFRGDPFPGDLGAFLDRGGRVLKDLGLPRLHMALAVLVVRGEEATIASGGMPPAWIYRAGSATVEEILVPGAPLGALVDTPHAVRSFCLGPGDVVLLSSDGLAESPGPDGEPLGYVRARQFFLECAPLPPEEALATLTRREEEWRKETPRADDLTLVLLRREG
jgi:serine phosphatase RsbU (regulator of sigma subunit)